MKRAMMIVFAVALATGILLAQTPQQTAPTTSQEPPASTLPQTGTPAQTSTPATTAPQPSTPAQTGTAAQSATTEQNAAHVAPGSIIPVRLTKTVDAKKAKQGDQVVATVPGDLKATNGQVVIPKDTKVIGHVTEAQKRGKDQKESQLGIAFDQMTMNGQQVQLPMSIQAIVAPQKNNATAASENQPPSAAGGSSSNYPSGGGRGGAMGGNTSAPTAPATSESAPNTNNSQAQSAPNPPITEDTKGMVGFKDMNLGASDGSNGSVVSSEKNNVKLEDGTLMLLRVSPAAQNQQSPQTPQTPQQE